MRIAKIDLDGELDPATNTFTQAANFKIVLEKAFGDDINKYIIPDRYKNKYGIWLIGYDGGDKSYSNDTSLLKEIHNIIDAMPIRKSEMSEQNEKCN